MIKIFKQPKITRVVLSVHMINNLEALHEFLNGKVKDAIPNPMCAEGLYSKMLMAVGLLSFHLQNFF